jgi:hypothetical protein
MIASRAWNVYVGQCLLALLCVVPLAVPAQEGKIEPVDEAAQDQSWLSFRSRLLKAIEKRDLKFVLGILDKNVRGSIDGKPGVAVFRKAWDVNAADTTLWQELRAALFLGSAYVKREKGPRELCAPYLLGKWPFDLDPNDYGVVITKDVLVKFSPSAESQTIQTLSYDIVSVRDWDVADKEPAQKQRWVRLRVKSGDGYVPEEQIRSPIEHSACFVKTQNGWRMTALAPAGG